MKSIENGTIKEEPTFPNWIKNTGKAILITYLASNSVGFLNASDFLAEGFNSKDIETTIERMGQDYSGFEKFIYDDMSSHGRQLAYLLHERLNQ